MNRLTRAAIAAIVLSTTAVPLAAEAQSRRDRDERRDDRRDRREDRREYRSDRRDDRREYRSERRDDRRDFRAERRDDRRDYRNNGGWDRNNRDWWRGRSEFRDYRGRRDGYWYAPGYGYHRVEPRYYGQSWRRGAYLPSSYHRYYVNDPYFYGLRAAPRGHRWVHADNDILLVALATGVIADVLFDVF